MSTSQPKLPLNCKATVGCLVRHGDKLIVVYEEQGTTSSWDIPAGGIEAGETPEQAITRELYEEIGLRAENNIQLIKIFWATLNHIPTVHFLYETKIDDATLESLKPHTTDIQKIASFSRNEVQNIIDTSSYEHDLAKARLELFLANEHHHTVQLVCITN